jgi:hypothetical protein
MRWTEYVPSIGKMRNAYKTLVEAHEGKRPLGRRRSRSNNLKIDVKERGYEGDD